VPEVSTNARFFIFSESSLPDQRSKEVEGTTGALYEHAQQIRIERKNKDRTIFSIRKDREMFSTVWADVRV
jgi:hypothetical protein